MSWSDSLTIDRRQAPLLAAGAPDAASGPLDREKRVTDALRRLQERAAAIQKETRFLSMARNGHSMLRIKVLDSVLEARRTADHTRRNIAELATAGRKTGHKQEIALRQRKLSENLQLASKLVEERWSEYEATYASLPAYEGGCELETFSSDADPERGNRSASRVLSMVQVVDVTDAELDTHAEIVQEYARDASRLSSEVQSLHGAMMDLAVHTVEQGKTLDCISDHMTGAVQSSSKATEQVQMASVLQKRGNRSLMYVFALVLLLCFAAVAASRS